MTEHGRVLNVLGSWQPLTGSSFNDIRFEYEISYDSRSSQLDARNEKATLYVSYGQKRGGDTIELSATPSSPSAEV